MTATSGSIRFNTDSSAKLEIYNGEEWWSVDSTSPAEQTGGTRGLVGGGYDHDIGDYSNTIGYFNIDSTGNAIDFGNLTAGRGNGVFGLASRTRGLWGCGYDGGPNTSSNIIDYVTISSTGNAVNFGDAAFKVEGARGFSDSTRGVFAYGFQRTDWASKPDLQYFTIASTGNAVDSGIDLTPNHRAGASLASPTRGIWAGGVSGLNSISYMTISTLSQVADFGDTSVDKGEGARGCSNAVRGIYFAGYKSPGSAGGDIDYITIASLGNGVDFGDATVARYGGMATASPTRGISAGGTPASRNVIEYVQIMSTGNAVDFGDLTVNVNGGNACSNGHGGLG
tara:strand:- start:246 stop:1262 length:1017 start_codon:yes stop_codon:yes gene_type:complete